MHINGHLPQDWKEAGEAKARAIAEELKRRREQQEQGMRTLSIRLVFQFSGSPLLLVPGPSENLKAAQALHAYSHGQSKKNPRVAHVLK